MNKATDIAYVLEASNSMIEIGGQAALLTTAAGMIVFFAIFFGGSYLIAEWLAKWK